MHPTPDTLLVKFHQRPRAAGDAGRYAVAGFELADCWFDFYSGTVKLRFYYDPTTDLPHIYDHDIDDVEVEQVLANSAEDRPGTMQSRVAIGRTEGGRILRVIYVRDPKPDSVFVITAYELKGKPLTAFRRRMKKKRK